jgi:hypothetical protein
VLRLSIVTRWLPLWFFIFFVSGFLVETCHFFTVCCWYKLRFPQTLHAISTRMLVAWKCIRPTAVVQREVSAGDTGILHGSMFMLTCEIFQSSFTYLFTAQKYYNKVTWLLLCIVMWNCADFYNVLIRNNIFNSKLSLKPLNSIYLRK